MLRAWPWPGTPEAPERTRLPQFPAQGSQLQARPQAMHAAIGFLGVLVQIFELAGRLQFARLIQNGLTPQSRVLDIGSSVLRLG